MDFLLRDCEMKIEKKELYKNFSAHPVEKKEKKEKFDKEIWLTTTSFPFQRVICSCNTFL